MAPVAILNDAARLMYLVARKGGGGTSSSSGSGGKSSSGSKGSKGSSSYGGSGGGGHGHKKFNAKIFGIVFGVIVGIILLIVGLYIWHRIRRRRSQRERLGHIEHNEKPGRFKHLMFWRDAQPKPRTKSLGSDSGSDVGPVPDDRYNAAVQSGIKPGGGV